MCFLLPHPHRFGAKYKGKRQIQQADTQPFPSSSSFRSSLLEGCCTYSFPLLPLHAHANFLRRLTYLWHVLGTLWVAQMAGLVGGELETHPFHHIHAMITSIIRDSPSDHDLLRELASENGSIRPPLRINFNDLYDLAPLLPNQMINGGQTSSWLCSAEQLG